MSSIEPDDGGSEVDRGQEGDGPLVVTGRDGAVLLELGEEVLDEMARLVQGLVVRTPVLAVDLGRDHRLLAHLLQRAENPSLGVERLVGDQNTGLDLRQQGIRALQVMRLPRREREPGRVAERVNQGVDLGAQAASAAPERLVAAVFLTAPALC